MDQARRSDGSEKKLWLKHADSCFLVIALGLSVSAATTGLTMLPHWVYYVGIGVMFAGIAFRQWAISMLGRYFSSVIGVQKEQKVVESGPYHLIMHP